MFGLLLALAGGIGPVDAQVGAAPASRSGASAAADARFLGPGDEDLLATNLIDLPLTHAGQRLGEIEDVLLSPGGAVRGYLLAVGGARDGGSMKHVALAASVVTMTKGTAGKWTAETVLTPEEIAAAPPIGYRSGFDKDD